jgi:hypothetical protein
MQQSQSVGKSEEIILQLCFPHLKSPSHSSSESQSPAFSLQGIDLLQHDSVALLGNEQLRSSRAMQQSISDRNPGLFL